MRRAQRVSRKGRKDGRTLSSILSLAAGAGALSAGDASASPFHSVSFAPVTVGFGAGQDPFWALTLPGTAGDIEIRALGTAADKAQIVARGTGTAGTVYLGGQSPTRSVGTLSFPGGNVAFRTAPMLSTGGNPSLSATAPNWNVNGGNRSASLAAAFIVSSARVRSTLATNPPSYTYVWKGMGPGAITDAFGKYLLFRFMNSDTTAVNYGWIHLVSATRTVGDKTGMSVTIDGWAYRDDGQPIGAGQIQQAPTSIPEIDPHAATSAAALAAGALSLLERRRLRGAGEAMGGALVSGAAGLRRWRRERASKQDAAVAS